MKTKKKLQGSASPQPKQAHNAQQNISVNVTPKLSNKKKVLHCLEVTVFIWTIFASALTLLLVLASASVYFSGTSIDQQVRLNRLTEIIFKFLYFDRFNILPIYFA